MAKAGYSTSGEGKPIPGPIALPQLKEALQLYREKHFVLKVRHSREKLRERRGNRQLR